MPSRIALSDDHGSPVEATERRLSRARRMRIIERDGFQCVRCDETEGLEVDHIKPLIDGGSEDDDNLETLCARHHKLKTAREAVARGKSNRIAAKHNGTAPPPTQKLRSRGFPSRWRGY